MNFSLIPITIQRTIMSSTQQQQSKTLNIKGNRKVVRAEYISESAFKIPDGLDLEDKSVVEKWWVWKYSLHIKYVGNEEIESIEGDNDHYETFKEPHTTSIEDAEEWPNVEYSDDEDDDEDDCRHPIPKKVKKVKKLVIVEPAFPDEPDDCVSDDGMHNLDEFGHCIRCCECKKCIKVLEEILDDSEDEEDDEDIDVCGETGREFDLRNPVKGCGKKLPDGLVENIMIGNISFCEDCAYSPEGQKYMDDEDAANAE